MPPARRPAAGCKLQLQEILATGRYSRNEALESSDMRRVLVLFNTVRPSHAW